MRLTLVRVIDLVALVAVLSLVFHWGRELLRISHESKQNPEPLRSDPEASWPVVEPLEPMGIRVHPLDRPDELTTKHYIIVP